MLIPMCLADRSRAFRFAGVCLVASVLGGVLGYFIGFYLYDAFGQSVLEFYGYGGKFTEFTERYNTRGAWIVFMAGLTPFPYKVITIASGVAQLDLWVFIVASITARGVRFFVLAGLLWKFGEPIRDFIERYFGVLSVAFFIFLIGGFVAIKWLL